MSANDGKAFEAKVKEDLLKIPGASVVRLYDVTTGYKSQSNVCDYIYYQYPYMFYIECKVTEANTLNFGRLRQYEDLVKVNGPKGVCPGVLIWFIKHGKVCWVNIEEVVRLEALGYKSINVKMIGDPEFEVYDIPGKKLRKFIDSDYKELLKIANKKFDLLTNL